MKQPATLRSAVRETGCSVETGRRFGPYEVLAPIAEGGMGSVHLARKRGSVGRLFAIKVETVDRCPEGSRGIENEARIGSRLQHAHVIPILDMVADAQGRTALVMDYIPGATASRLVRGSNACGASLPIPVVLRIVYDALLGLSALHRSRSKGTAHSAAHRDVAPANLLVGEDGVTRLGDFGISVTLDDESSRTRTMFEGRVAYMAPERLLGRCETDRRSDLFAMGVVLWEAITGRRLFCGSDDAESRANVLAGVVPPLERFRRGVAPLDAVVASALAPAPEDRFQSAEAFLDALETVAATFGGFATSRTVAATVAAFGCDPRAESRDAVSVEPDPFDSLGTTAVEDEPPTALANRPAMAMPAVAARRG